MTGGGCSILYVITDLMVGGVPLHLHRLAMAVQAHGFRPAVVSLAPPGPVSDRLRADGIPVDSCDACCGWDLRVFSRLKSKILRHKPDIVHAMLFHANVAARFATRGAGIPASRVLCEIQTVEVERRWHLTVDRWTNGRIRLTIGNSPSVIDHLHRNGRIPLEKLRLVRGGIDPTRVANAQPASRSELGIPANAAIILWSGRLDPVKGLAHLIDAFHLIHESCDVHLMLAGEGGERGALQLQIARLGLADRIHLLGVRSDVPSLLKAADLFVFPSRTEGLPNALLEAMAAGCPIITTDVPGCRDLIRHEVNGLVVKYGNTSGLSQALRELLENREFARKLGQHATMDAAENWHIEKTHDHYAKLYNEVLHE